MHVEVDYNGITYISKETSEISAEELASKVYDSVAELDRFEMNLKDGGKMVIGPNAVKSCVFRFCP